MAIQDEWDRILEQGYLDFEGFAPDAGYQMDQYFEGLNNFGLVGPDSSMLTAPIEGGAWGHFLGPGVGAATVKGAPHGAFRPEKLFGGTHRVNIRNEQDLLDYLQWSASLGVHNKARRGKLGIGQADYTGQDVYDYFVKPGERQGFEDQRRAAKQSWKDAQAIGGALSEQYGSRLGLGGGTQAEYLRQAGGATGGKWAEQALLGGMGQYASGVTEGMGRLSELEKLSLAFGGGHEERMAEDLAVAGGAQSVGNIGMAAGAASSNPWGILAGALVKGGSMIPEQIARSQAGKHRRAGAARQAEMADVSPVAWRVPQAGLLRGTQAITPTRFGGSSEAALRNIYQDDEEEKRFRSTFA